MTDRIDFKALTTPKTPNWCLAAPDGLCRNAVPQIVVPTISASTDQVWDRLLAAVAKEPRVTIHDQDKASGYFDFTQVSMLFRFPDRVSIQVMPMGQGQSSLAIFSRSKYGRSDLGVNAKRVRRLLAAVTGS